MKNENGLTNKKEKQEVQELAFLVVSKDRIGVTNSLADLNAVIVSDSAEKEPVKIWMGEKTEMLEAEYKIMLQDAVNKVKIPKGFGKPTLVTPNYFEDYHINDRGGKEAESVESKPQDLPVVLKHYK